MTAWRYRIYEFVDSEGVSVIRRWLDARDIASRDRAQLLVKTDMLAAHGSELLGGLLAGPVASKRTPKLEKHIFKLVIHGSVMLRPFLCRGPIEMDDEFTFLLGAIEKGGVLDEDTGTAEEHRRIILADPTRRIRNGRYR